MSDEFLTLREKIMELLLKSNEPLSVSEIASYLGIDQRNKRIIYDALQHIAKTIRRKITSQTTTSNDPSNV